MLARREGWPLGATSDDTAQLLLLAEALVDGPVDEEIPGRFLERLADELETIRGSGPTTRAAVERYRESGTLEAPAGDTNGAAMRALPLGWAIPDDERRRRLTLSVTRTTHGGPAAAIAAAIVAALADRLLGGAEPEHAPRIALGEVTALAGELPAELAATELAAVARGDWRRPQGGITLSAIETVAAVLHVLAQGGRVAETVERAIRLGGDTDTVAAIAAGLLASHPAHAPDPLPWADDVVMPADLSALASQLARVRATG